LKVLGLTELRCESEEPSLAEVLAEFPAGEYEFEGTTVDGEALDGSAVLSHDLPPAPSFSPSNGELVDRNNTVVTWTAIPGVAGSQVIVEQPDLDVSMAVDLSASTTSLHVSPTFLQPNTAYKAKVIADSTNGNRTISEGTFITMP